MRRFFAPKENFVGDDITLNAGETRHLRDVLRLHVGDEVAIFDGDGNEYTAQIASIERSSTTAALLKKIEPSAPESPVAITLASVVIPGDKYDLIVQKAVELGVVNLVPLASIRSEVKVRDLIKRLTRWRRIALDAAKQCGRATLMTISEPRNVEEFLSEKTDADAKIFFSERDGVKVPDLNKPKSLVTVIGPKGGWDDIELETAITNGYSIVTLGGRIMRAETAAIALTAILQHRFGDMN